MIFDDLAPLPAELRQKAHRVNSEHMFYEADAQAVIDWLESHDYALVGWECILPEEHWTKFEVKDYGGSEKYEPYTGWETFVHICAQSARNFVKNNAVETAIIFSLSWYSQEEIISR